MEEMKAGSYKEIELLRGFAILAVIMIHIAGRSMQIKEFSSTMLIFRTIVAACEFAVPLFFIISGFTLSIKHDDYSTASFYRKRLANIVPPYIIFSLLYILFNSWYASLPVDSAADLAIQILTARAFLHLWYFRIIFQFYLVYPLIKNFLHNRRNNLLAILVAAVTIQIIWVCFCVPIHNWCAGYIHPSFVVYLSYHSLISYIGYFVFGIYVFHHYHKLQLLYHTKWFTLCIIAVILCGALIRSYFRILDQHFQKFPLIASITIFYVMAVAVLLLKICNALKSKDNLWARTLFRLGQYSFGIYLIHVMIILIAERLLLLYAHINTHEWYYYPVCLLITVGLSLPATYLISRMPRHELLIGKVRRWKLSD